MVERRLALKVPVNGEDVSVPSALHLRCPKCDEVVLRYSAPGTSGGRIALGEVHGRIVPAVTAKCAKHSGGPAGDECQNLVPSLTQRPVGDGHAEVRALAAARSDRAADDLDAGLGRRRADDLPAHAAGRAGDDDAGGQLTPCDLVGRQQLRPLAGDRP